MSWEPYHAGRCSVCTTQRVLAVRLPMTPRAILRRFVESRIAERYSA